LEPFADEHQRGHGDDSGHAAIRISTGITASCTSLIGGSGTRRWVGTLVQTFTPHHTTPSP
jgi:hypothetical protein